MTPIETLADLKAHRMGLYASCTAQYAGHGAPLDIDMLIERFGPDYVFINEQRIGASCVCRKCGHRGAELRVTVGNGPSWAH